MADKLLELSTTREDPDFITIDGVAYDLISPDDLSIRQQHRLKHKAERMQKLFDSEDLSDEDEQELTKIVGDLFQTVTANVPEDIAAALSTYQKGQISNVFFSKLALSVQIGSAAEN